MAEFKNALISVSDKSGLVEFVKELANKGTRLLSTGGTAKVLREAGLTVIDVSEQTGFPEVMGGRVKTLHPKIHMALLARDYDEDDLKTLESNEISMIDLVVGNLYPFESLPQEELSDRRVTDLIDIGGPSFLRAAAKSFLRMTVVCDPADYPSVLAEPNELDFRKRLAAKVFSHTASYDAMIAQRLQEEVGRPWFAMGGVQQQELRYGENPQQTATWFQLRGQKTGLHSAELLHGKPLSYNNLLDVDAAVRTVMDFPKNSCVAVKHNNPCGIAVCESVSQSVEKALAADPVSVFGGIIAVRGRVDVEAAEKLSSLFLECIIAEGFDQEAQQLLGKKKNLRLLGWPEISSNPSNRFEVKSVLGGFLVQSPDDHREVVTDCKWTGAVDEPDLKIAKTADLAWRACVHLKSNAIALASGDSTVGMGMGQVNRVDAVKQSIERMQEHHPGATEVVLASDAFFPFPDSVELAAAAGIKWVIQPGGSIKDQEVINRAKELGIGVILTGVRHFKH